MNNLPETLLPEFFWNWTSLRSVRPLLCSQLYCKIRVYRLQNMARLQIYQDYNTVELNSFNLEILFEDDYFTNSVKLLSLLKQLSIV